MEKIAIDLDWAGIGRRATAWSGETVEISIRRDTLRNVLGKLAAKPFEEDEAERDDPRSCRPLALNVMAHRRHDAILISARRGDGKTTFLTDILRLRACLAKFLLPRQPPVRVAAVKPGSHDFG
jgi:hypothetical protein